MSPQTYLLIVCGFVFLMSCLWMWFIASVARQERELAVQILKEENFFRGKLIGCLTELNAHLKELSGWPHGRQEQVVELPEYPDVDRDFTPAVQELLKRKAEERG